MSQTYLLAIITYLVGYGCWVIVVMMSGTEETEEAEKEFLIAGRGLKNWRCPRCAWSVRPRKIALNPALAGGGTHIVG